MSFSDRDKSKRKLSAVDVRKMENAHAAAAYEGLLALVCTAARLLYEALPTEGAREDYEEEVTDLIGAGWCEANVDAYLPIATVDLQADRLEELWTDLAMARLQPVRSFAVLVLPEGMEPFEPAALVGPFCDIAYVRPWVEQYIESTKSEDTVCICTVLERPMADGRIDR